MREGPLVTTAVFGHALAEYKRYDYSITWANQLKIARVASGTTKKKLCIFNIFWLKHLAKGVYFMKS